MTKKSRYALIVLGFISFLILAPLMVLYVRGLSYNFTDGRFVQTGILSYVADPKGSQFFLNGELKRNSSGDISFLPAGEYQITVKSPGRMDWNKRLAVFAGQVTWANPKDSKVYLFLEPQKPKTLAENVLDFFNHGNDVVFLQNQTAVVSKLNDSSLTHNYPLPKPVNKILAVDDSGENFIFTNSNSLTTTIIFFNAVSGKIIDLSALLKNADQFTFSGNDLYVLSNDTMYKVNTTLKSLTAVVQNIQAFAFQGDDIYLLQKSKQQNQLVLLQRPYTESQILMDNLPILNKPKLFISFRKQIFILSASKFYLANTAMKELAENVSDINFDDSNQAVSISQSGELDYYDTYGQSFNFITRSIYDLKNPVILNSISHAFYSANSKIFATELDNRNNQNSYSLYSGDDIQKFSVDQDGKNIVVLDSGQIKYLKIR